MLHRFRYSILASFYRICFALRSLESSLLEVQLCADAELQLTLGGVWCVWLYLLAVDRCRRFDVEFEVVGHAL